MKPVQGPDGNRVPLLRTGFRPAGAYTVSFVFLHSGTPFAKKGGSDIALPKMDVPISILEWELFLPDQFKVKDFSGDAILASLVPAQYQAYGYAGGAYQGGVAGGTVPGAAPAAVTVNNIPMNGRNFAEISTL